MVLFIFGVLFFLPGLALTVIRKVDWDGEDFPLWIPGVICLIVSLLMLLGSTYKSVGAREVGIPVTFGHVGSDVQPGVHFMSPWVTIHKCSLGQQQSIQTQSSTDGDKQGGDGIAINGSDQGAAIADTTVLYHFDPSHANTIYRKYACDSDLVKQNLIRQALKGAVPSASSAFLSTDLKSHRAEIQKSTEDILNDDFAGDGIVVDNVILSEIDLSQAVQSAADAKLQAQQAAQQAEFNRQKAQVDAQTQQINANAEKVANDAKTLSLTPAVLCQQWIQAIGQAHISVLTVNGPCAGVGGTSPNLQVQVPAGQS